MATIAHQKAHEALALLERHERDAAGQALEQAARFGPPSGAFWKSIATLASRIGEIDVAIEANRRFSRTEPMVLSRHLHYWGELARYGRERIAIEEIGRLPAQMQDHHSVLHFRGQIAAQSGDFDLARDLYARALKAAPFSAMTWSALAAITDFAQEPALFDRMRAVEAQLGQDEPLVRARFQYSLGRAYHDLGEPAAAMRHYMAGAQIRRSLEDYDPDGTRAKVEMLLDGYTPEAMGRLSPPEERYDGAIIVNGLPRSGTTLVEQILTAHQDVLDGAEVALLGCALTPAGSGSIDDAMRYQERSVASGQADPWGDVARQYRRMLGMRFGADGRVVDKSLIQSHIMGLLAHAIPDCPVVWLRRSPGDVALSCFRNYFSDSLPWSWSFSDIGQFMALEDRLYAHWTQMFPERILTVPYEELVESPAAWIARICTHAGLKMQPQLERFYETKRVVRTASLHQVRQPITKNRIGLSSAYDRWMDEFWRAYQQE